MKPDEALFYLANPTPGVSVPQVYRDIEPEHLQLLVLECAGPAGGVQAGEPDGRAVGRPRRLTTPARRRAAFLYYLGRCPSVAEAASRCGIDRRTAQRWRDRFPAFAARWAEIIERKRTEAVDDAILAATTPEVRRHYFRGRPIAEERRRTPAAALSPQGERPSFWNVAVSAANGDGNATGLGQRFQGLGRR